MRILIGIPCYGDVPPEVLEDYMRFTFYLGRRLTEHDFLMGIKTKSEQFRARNAFCKQALLLGCDYLLMLDDDHIIDWQNQPGPNERYDFVRKLIAHDKPIIGPLYYQRGGTCYPVLMKEGRDGAYYFMRDDEITGGLQEVGVQGGGCMLIKSEVLAAIGEPWFEPEIKFGTDIQICGKARDKGFSVWCDTSIELGHILKERTVITSHNRHYAFADTCERQGVQRSWLQFSWHRLWYDDALEFSGITEEDIIDLAREYQEKTIFTYEDFENKDDYYRSLGKQQLARQLWFHSQRVMMEQATAFLKIFNPDAVGYGLDFACGSAPIGFELAMRGHKVDFVDLDGAYAYEFTKWRSNKRRVQGGFELKGPYDFILLMDAIEHFVNWEEIMEDLAVRLREGGTLLSNFMLLGDEEDLKNHEHVFLDKRAFNRFLAERGVYPVSNIMWVKRNESIYSDASKGSKHGPTDSDDVPPDAA